MIGEIFQAVLYRPLFNALVFLYETVAFEDLGIAIILLTVTVRLVLYPIFHKTAKHQRIAQKLQPEIKKIRDKHKKDREAQTRAIMALYQEHRVNPMTPFLLLLLQLPVLFALYRIFINGFANDALSLLYPFVPEPTELTQDLFGVVLLDTTNLYLVALAALLQFVQGKMALRRSKNQKGMPEQAEKVARATVLIGPALALVILYRFPAAVALYWLTSTIFSIAQQAIVNRSVDKDDAGTTGKNKQDG